MTAKQISRKRSVAAIAAVVALAFLGFIASMATNPQGAQARVVVSEVHIWHTIGTCPYSNVPITAKNVHAFLASAAGHTAVRANRIPDNVYRVMVKQALKPSAHSGKMTANTYFDTMIFCGGGMEYGVIYTGGPTTVFHFSVSWHGKIYQITIPWCGNVAGKVVNAPTFSPKPVPSKIVVVQAAAKAKSSSTSTSQSSANGCTASATASASAGAWAHATATGFTWGGAYKTAAKAAAKAAAGTTTNTKTKCTPGTVPGTTTVVTTTTAPPTTTTQPTTTVTTTTTTTTTPAPAAAVSNLTKLQDQGGVLAGNTYQICADVSTSETMDYVFSADQGSGSGSGSVNGTQHVCGHYTAPNDTQAASDTYYLKVFDHGKLMAQASQTITVQPQPSRP